MNKMHEYIYTCPYCGKEKHFYVNSYKRVYYCQRCKKGGKLKNVPLEFKMSLEGLDEPSELKPPPVSHPLSPQSVTYLLDRLECTMGDLPLHVVITETEDGLLFLFPEPFSECWQLRRWRHKGKPRCISSPSVGLYILEGNNPPLIVEGILDALKVNIHTGREVVAILGSKPSESQMLAIADTYDEVELLLDRDVTPEQVSGIGFNLSKLGLIVRKRNILYNDPCEATPEYLRNEFMTRKEL